MKAENNPFSGRVVGALLAALLAAPLGAAHAQSGLSEASMRTGPSGLSITAVTSALRLVK